MSETHSSSAPHFVERLVAGTTVVELRGEIDLVTAPQLSARLDVLTAGPGPDLVLDLRAVSFIDCTGLGVLCRARNRARTHLGRLRLVSQSAHLERLLRATRLADVFETHTRLADALGPGPGTGAVSAVTG